MFREIEFWVSSMSSSAKLFVRVAQILQREWGNDIDESSAAFVEFLYGQAGFDMSDSFIGPQLKPYTYQQLRAAMDSGLRHLSEELAGNQS